MTAEISKERTRNYVKQIKGAFIYKAIAVLASFLTIPIMIRYLGPAQFGVWSTLVSVMSWIALFDLGLGNGLRNKLAESLARDQNDEAQGYISSAYSLIGAISLVIFLIVALAAFNIPWQRVFNTDSVPTQELSYAVLATGFFVSLNFWLGLINSVLNAVQRTAVVVLGQFISNITLLISIFILAKITTASFLYLTVICGISMVAANILLSAYFFKDNLKLFPRMSIDSRHVSPLLNLGLQFFAIQIAVLIIYSTSRILITQLYGPEFVTHYDVAFKLFSIIILLHGLIAAPLTSAYTDAYHRGDVKWIRRMLLKQMQFFCLLSLSVIILTFLAKPIISLWVGPDLNVSMPLILSMGGFTAVSIWTNIFASFLNGVGKIRVSVVVSVSAMFLNIPVCILLSKFTTLDASTVVIGTIIALTPGVFSGPYQTYKILTFKDIGIWGR